MSKEEVNILVSKSMDRQYALENEWKLDCYDFFG